MTSTKIDALLETFKECLKEKTIKNEVDEMYDINEKLIDKKHIIEIWSVILIRKKINFNEIDINELINYWENLINNDQDEQTLLYIETKIFLNEIKPKIRLLNYNYYFDFLDTKKIDFETIYLFLVNFLDKLNFIYIYKKNSIDVFKDSESIESLINNNKLSKKQFSFLWSKTRVFSFKKDLLNIIEEKFDFANFYRNYLYKERNILTHWSSFITFFEAEDVYKIIYSIDKKSEKSGLVRNFKEQTVLAILYDILVYKVLNEEYIKNFYN